MFNVSNQFTVIYGGKPISYNTIMKKVDYYYNYFNLSKHSKRTAVLFTSSHSPEFLYIMLAVWKAGLVAVPLDSKITYEQMLNYKIPTLHNFIIHYNETTSSYRNQFFVNENAGPERINGDLIIYTSGTESSPKGIVHNFETLTKAAEFWGKLANVSNNDMWIASIPLYHIGGISILFRAMLFGTKLFFPSRIKSLTMFDEIKRLNVTYMSLVNPQLEYLVNNNVELPKTLKQIYLGGSAITKSLLLKAKEKNLPAILVYGSTETGAMISSVDLKDIDNFDNINYKPFDGVDISVDKFEDDESGLIKVLSPSNCVAKIENGEFIKLNPTDPISINDIIKLNEDKTFSVLGRVDNVIISGGYKVNLSKIQSLMMNFQSVKDVYLKGIEDEKLGAKLIAVLYTEDNIDKEELKRYLEENLGKYEIPKSIYVTQKPFVNDLGKAVANEIIPSLNKFEQLI
ncbi:MAG TPA: AMP-binding protein [Ignavibacteriales bacterium]|nr:AMP-binding protein [Ignavibacteriales bacterium]HOL81790.1 AMP-binding protein [Ignavibacteriales bacterium]HOM65836.1 AMP-binding protein [Ignavibacteriales bacterium]HPD67061.1 AMP-binding protein [Ignavibacteriales bacterium]HPP33927.1 AMP-binding protein [Ignavibacteriales bacterium]